MLRQFGQRFLLNAIEKLPDPVDQNLNGAPHGHA